MRRAWKTFRRIIRERRQLARARRPIVWWMLTVSPRMYNLGDQAQAVAAERWLRDRLDMQPIELDKDEYGALAALLKWIIRPGELILIQSGGNLGDRGIATERQRRRIIGDFRRNPIVSLQQTISFSDTAKGHSEAEASTSTYASHPALDVVARDAASLNLGRALFADACHMMAPDFVLQFAGEPRSQARAGVLLVLRGDQERRLSSAQHDAIEAALEGMSVTRADTIVDYPIRRGRRDAVINETLDTYASHEVVVTDRFHGMIFAWASDTPCVVMENIDHKIRSGIEWLEGCPSIRLASPDEPLGPLIEEVMAAARPSSCTEVQVRLDQAFAGLEELVRSRVSGTGGGR